MWLMQTIPEGADVITETPVPIPDDVAALLNDTVAAGSRRGMFRGVGTDGRASAREAQRIVDTGSCVAVDVQHDQPPVVANHEHGLIVLIRRGDDTAHLLDISSVADDPRWALHSTGALWTRWWSWVRAGDLGPFRFTATGEPLAPPFDADLHGTRLEAYLTESDDGWPGDDAVLAITFADAVAWLRE